MSHYRPARPTEGSIIPRALKAYLREESLPFLQSHDIPVKELWDIVDVPFTTQKDFFTKVEVALALRALRSRDHRPALLGLAGAAVMLGGKFVLGSPPLVYAGSMLLIGASIWSVRSPAPPLRRPG